MGLHLRQHRRLQGRIHPDAPLEAQRQGAIPPPMGRKPLRLQQARQGLLRGGVARAREGLPVEPAHRPGPGPLPARAPGGAEKPLDLQAADRARGELPQPRPGLGQHFPPGGRQGPALPGPLPQRLRQGLRQGRREPRRRGLWSRHHRRRHVYLRWGRSVAAISSGVMFLGATPGWKANPAAA